MHRVTLPSFAVQEFSSCGVTMADARVDEPFAVDLATYAAGALLGRHPTRLWQLLHVISGTGWAAGSDDGMVALIVQSPEPPLTP